MVKTNLKSIKERIKDGIAIDFTNANYGEIQRLSKNLTGIAYSIGKNGVNGLLFKDENNIEYAIAGNSLSLWLLDDLYLGIPDIRKEYEHFAGLDKLR